MSNPDQDIRAARLLERQRRNNPWAEPAVTEHRQTDAEIINSARQQRLANWLYYLKSKRLDVV